MQEVMLSLVDDYGYAAITFLIWVENVFPPIPSEAVLLFAGFLTTHSALSPWGMVGFATLGSVLGALVLYAAGRWIGKERLCRLAAGKAGRLLHLSGEDIEKANRWFARYETKAVLFGRCIPIVRSLISIPAGISGMRIVPFLIYTVLGSTAWNTLLVWMGRFAGAAWQQSLQYLGWYTRAAAAVLAAACALGVYFFLKKRKQP